MTHPAWLWSVAIAAGCSFPEVTFDDGGASAQGGGGAASGGSTAVAMGGAPAGGSSAGGSGGGGATSMGGGGSGGGTPNCIDEDNDQYLAIGSDPACLADPQYHGNKIDCDDDNAQAHPEQAGFFGTPRSNGSYDYDCDTVETGFYLTMCDLSEQSLVVPNGMVGCGATWPRKSAAAVCLAAGSDQQTCH